MIRARGLAKSFGGKRVLDGLDFEIAPGERVALTGPNGAGKTTLLRILSTLLLPSSGEAWVAGHSVISEPLAARAKLGFVPATDQGFFPRFTGLENLVFFGSLRGISAKGVEASLEELREFRPLTAALETPFHASSSGMRQSLAVARACLGSPGVLLLDEPTRSLDRETTATLHAFLARWCGRGERALLLASHSDAEIERLCTRELKLVPARQAEAVL